MSADSGVKLLPKAPTLCESFPLLLPFFLLLAAFAPLERCEEVKGRGKGEGSSSTDSECGFKKGPLVMGPFAMDDIPPAPGVLAARGVGGGEVPPPSLLRSLRVM